MTFDIIKAIILGIVEGLTEFVPVSSTGHLLLVQRFFGFADEEFGKTFAILIQFGAILALLSIYFARLWRLAIGFAVMLGLPFLLGPPAYVAGQYVEALNNLRQCAVGADRERPESDC